MKRIAPILAIATVAGCIQYKAATMVVKPQSPVVTGSAGVQLLIPGQAEVADADLGYVGSVCEDQPATAGQVMYVGESIEQVKNFDVEADASDTIAPETAVDLPGAP